MRRWGIIAAITRGRLTAAIKRACDSAFPPSPDPIMHALVLLALVACATASHFAYPGGHHGVHGFHGLQHPGVHGYGHGYGQYFDREKYEEAVEKRVAAHKEAVEKRVAAHKEAVEKRVEAFTNLRNAQKEVLNAFSFRVKGKCSSVQWCCMELVTY